MDSPRSSLAAAWILHLTGDVFSPDPASAAHLDASSSPWLDPAPSRPCTALACSRGALNPSLPFLFQNDDQRE